MRGEGDLLIQPPLPREERNLPRRGANKKKKEKKKKHRIRATGRAIVVVTSAFNEAIALKKKKKKRRGREGEREMDGAAESAFRERSAFSRLQIENIALDCSSVDSISYADCKFTHRSLARSQVVGPFVRCGTARIPRAAAYRNIVVRVNANRFEDHGVSGRASLTLAARSIFRNRTRRIIPPC